MDNSSFARKQKARINQTDKLSGALVQSLFKIDDEIKDYDFENDEPQQAEKNKPYLESLLKNNQQSEQLGEKSIRKKKKDFGKFAYQYRLQPLQKETPHKKLNITSEQIGQNSENKEKAEKQKKKKVRKKNLFDFDSELEEENQIQKEEENKKEEIRQREKSRQSSSQSSKRKSNEQQPNLSKLPEVSIIERIKPENVYSFILRRDQAWLNKFHPVFHIHFKSNNQYYFSAKKTSNSATPTYLISSHPELFEENENHYLGKVKENFMGNTVNIYSSGPNPSAAQQKGIKPRELLATIEYQTKIFGSSRPRDFNVYALKDGVSYYQIRGTNLYEDEIPLSDLYRNEENKQFIHVMSNKKPQWNNSANGYMLHFNGRVKKPSVKNFILLNNEEEQQEGTNKEAMMFGKIEENMFRLDIASPLSPLIGFGIALSSFGSKIGCQ